MRNSYWIAFYATIHTTLQQARHMETKDFRRFGAQ